MGRTEGRKDAAPTPGVRSRQPLLRLVPWDAVVTGRGRQEQSGDRAGTCHMAKVLIRLDGGLCPRWVPVPWTSLSVSAAPVFSLWGWPRDPVALTVLSRVV